jgi:hypothetical protein
MRGQRSDGSSGESTPDEDDPETFVNTVEKRIELDNERRKKEHRSIFDKVSDRDRFHLMDKIDVASDSFKQYFEMLLDNGTKNVEKTHVCLSCWIFISKS